MDATTTIYTHEGDLIPADRWFWTKGNNWIAVSAEERREDWFASVREEGVAMPLQTSYPIERRPTFGTLNYRRKDDTQVREPALR
jgi:hypothetical protein